MAILDVLLANSDRHSANAMVKDGKLYAIDHGYTMNATVPKGGSEQQFAGAISSVAINDLGDDDLPVSHQHELAERIADMNVERVLDGSNLNPKERAAFDRRREVVVNLLRDGAFSRTTVSNWFSVW
jgi:hypothetical protein